MEIVQNPSLRYKADCLVQ